MAIGSGPNLSMAHRPKNRFQEEEDIRSKTYLMITEKGRLVVQKIREIQKILEAD